METSNSEHSPEDSSQSNLPTLSNLLLFNELKRTTEGDTLEEKPVHLNDTLKHIEPQFSDEELFDVEDLGSSVPTKTDISTEQSVQEGSSLFRLSDRTLYQAGHSTLRRIQGAAEVASNRITDWIKPLIPTKLTGAGPEDRSIYMLGTTYSFTQSELAEIKEKYPLEFMEDFKSRLWFTYRTGFTPIQPSDYVSDVGWGCMLRSAQMLLGQALVMLKLGREWRKSSTCVESQIIYAQIVRLFLDDLTIHTPFSLHNFCAQGRQLGKAIGEWFGPATASQAIKALVNSYETLNLGVYVATDGVIYKDQLRVLTQDHKPLLVLLPTRLGINTLNPIYFPAIKKLLELPQSLGIAGGKPSASLYFVAYEGDLLYYLDPHYSRSAISRKTATTDKLTEEELSTYHCDDIRTINIQKIDPCMLFGFLCRDQAEINSFLQRLEELCKECEAPILAVAHDTPMYLSDEEFGTFEEGFEMLN